MVASPGLNFDLDAYVSPRRLAIESKLDQYLEEQNPRILFDSMRYSALSAGKKFRALLCLASAEIVENRQPGSTKALHMAMPCACAIEMIHAMSLIHDDLPCMDNDDFRRGKPTNHKVFGEAMALLAGDALLVYATETLLKKTPLQVERHLLIDVAAELAVATGPSGMVGSQVMDSVATGLVPQAFLSGLPSHKSSSALPQVAAIPQGQIALADQEASYQPGAQAELLESIHRRKTGALLRFSAWSGARLMGADERTLSALATYGEVLGLAFQIADDLLDLTGDLSTLGKTPGKDKVAGKLTWVSVFGVDGSRKALQDLEEQAKSQLIQADLPEQSFAVLCALLAYGSQRKS